MLKKNRIHTIFKFGDRNNISNYRPISILPVLHKIFGKFIFTLPSSFVEKFNIISENQFGFRKRRSTEHATLNLTNSILPAFKNNTYCASIFIDFRKAFYIVNHSILFNKQNKVGVRSPALIYFTSYLENGTNFTTFKSVLSPSKACNFGVPQGSCLGASLI